MGKQVEVGLIKTLLKYKQTTHSIFQPYKERRKENTEGRAIPPPSMVTTARPSFYLDVSVELSLDG
jgi:hypothetical protein